MKMDERDGWSINFLFSALIRGSGCVGGQRFGGLKSKLQPQGSMLGESLCKTLIHDTVLSESC